MRLMPAPLAVAAHPAAPILRIVVSARQQLAGARRLDDGDGTIAPRLCALGVERHEEMQTLAGVGVQRGEERGVGVVEVGLIERDLCGVLRKGFLESVALDRAPVLGVERLVLPQTRDSSVDAGQGRARDDDSVGVPAKQPARRREKPSTSGGANLNPAAISCCARSLFEDNGRGRRFRAVGRVHRLAPPIVLHLAQAFRADDARAEIWPGVLRRAAAACSIASLIATLIGAIERLARLKSSMAVPHYRSIGSLSSSGVINGPPAAALAWRAITSALDFLVMPRSLMSRAIMALRMSRMAVSRNSTMVSRDHSPSGLTSRRRASPPAPAGSPRPRRHPTARGSRAGHPDGLLGVEAFGGRLLGARRDPAEQDGSDDPAPFDIAQPPDRRARRNDAVDLTTLRAAAMAAAVARRCQMSSIAAGETGRSACGSS